MAPNDHERSLITDARRSAIERQPRVAEGESVFLDGSTSGLHVVAVIEEEAA
jgi:hypothetical protein